MFFEKILKNIWEKWQLEINDNLFVITQNIVRLGASL